MGSFTKVKLPCFRADLGFSMPENTAEATYELLREPTSHDTAASLRCCAEEPGSFSEMGVNLLIFES
jgi:hypothetical protein